MSLIIIHHFIVHCLKKDSFDPIIYDIIYPFFTSGVNLFFLISGWFTIRFSVRKLLSFIILILFYVIINQILCYSSNNIFSWGEIIKILLWPVSRSPYWFLQTYVFLMILAPLINEGVSHLSIRKLRILMVIFTFGTIYSCNIGQNRCNIDGYTFMQGLYMYLVGTYLHKDEQLFQNIKTGTCIIGILIFTALGALLPILTDLNAFTFYNSFNTIGASVLLFLAMSRLKFYNQTVNKLGIVALGCYLLQDGTFGNDFLYSYLHRLWLNGDSISDLILFFTLLFFGYWFVSYLIHPTLKKISDIVSSKLTQLSKSLLIIFHIGF